MEGAAVTILVVAAFVVIVLLLTWVVIWMSFKIADWMNPPSHSWHCVCSPCKEKRFKQAIEEREYLRHQEEIRRVMSEMDREKL